MAVVLLSVFAVTARAESLEITVEILPDGQDTYSDGTPVLDDETYVIVWTKSPDTEVNFDETFMSDDDIKVFVNAPMAKDGCCPCIQFQFDKSYYQENSLDTGYFRLFSTNALRRKGNSAIPFEIRETKVSVKIGNNYSSVFTSTAPANQALSPVSSVVAPGSSPTVLSNQVDVPSIMLEKIVFVGDWMVLYTNDNSDKNQNEPLILISHKKGELGFLNRVVFSGGTGSAISEGNMAIIVGVAAAVVFGLGGFLVGKKNTIHNS